MGEDGGRKGLKKERMGEGREKGEGGANGKGGRGKGEEEENGIGGRAKKRKRSWERQRIGREEGVVVSGGSKERKDKEGDEEREPLFSMNMRVCHDGDLLKASSHVFIS